MKAMLVRVLRALTRIFYGSKTYVAVEVDDVPDRPQPGRVYVVGERGSPWCAAFLCPCGCRGLVQLSLVADDSPSWSLSTAVSGKVTLRPSINRFRGCRAHFFVRGGRVVWAGNGASPAT